jgi:TetR/AcrR family transcriptional regulator, fatty acid metabolism regulator protein
MKGTAALMKLTSPKPEKNDLFPPGRIKIRDAIKTLLEQKSFNEITWSEIAKTASVSEALIYKYYGNRESLLHEISQDYAEGFLEDVEDAFRGMNDTLSKLRKAIWMHANFFNKQRVLARVLLIEIRGSPGYFDSRAYDAIRAYGKVLQQIIEEGMLKKEIRSDVPSKQIRQMIFGCVDYCCLPNILYGLDYSSDEITEAVCKVIFPGIVNAPGL